VTVTWSTRAQRDLAAIRAYIASDDPRAADRLLEQLIARAESLVALPRRGRPVPELPGRDLRELIVGNYRLVYRARGQHVEILSIFEGHREFPEDVQ
jgi:toxin ParE1/3/4